MKATVHYLFSKSELIGSKVIRWGTNHIEPTAHDIPSHVAILVNERWVFESTLNTGVQRISYVKWKKKHTEVAKYKCTKPWKLKEIIDCFRQIHHKKYDYWGLTYFSFRIALHKFFNKPLPKINKWNKENMYFCCEVMGKMLGLDYQMNSPVQVMIQTKRNINKANN